MNKEQIDTLRVLGTGERSKEWAVKGKGFSQINSGMTESYDAARAEEIVKIAENGMNIQRGMQKIQSQRA